MAQTWQFLLSAVGRKLKLWLARLPVPQPNVHPGGCNTLDNDIEGVMM